MLAQDATASTPASARMAERFAAVRRLRNNKPIAPNACPTIGLSERNEELRSWSVSVKTVAVTNRTMLTKSAVAPASKVARRKVITHGDSEGSATFDKLAADRSGQSRKKYTAVQSKAKTTVGAFTHQALKCM